MDAFEISGNIKSIWMDNHDKRDRENELAVMVHTKDGFREVIGVAFNKDINAIQLILDPT